MYMYMYMHMYMYMYIDRWYADIDNRPEVPCAGKPASSGDLMKQAGPMFL